MSIRAINAYNHTVRAERYNASKGFDPARKERMLGVVVQHLVELALVRGTLLELGTGTGLLTQKILNTEHFGKMIVTDGAPAMLSIAKRQLNGAKTELSFGQLDFSHSSWVERFSNTLIHAVASSMVIHHLPDKRHFFREVASLLDECGVFVFADHMASSSAPVDRLIGRERARVKLESGHNNTIPEPEIAAFIEADSQKQAAEGNLCESVASYLDYLSDASFRHVDCLWRDYWLAVFVAIK